jgi:hypothetical protein
VTDGALPPADEVRDHLLADLRFEDDQGLWEVEWSLHAQCPNADLASRIELARRVVLGLLEASVVVGRRVDWGSFDGPLLTGGELERLRHEDAPWHDPEGTDLLVQLRAVEAS